MRIFLDIIFLFSIVLFPWWLSVFFGIALALRFQNFYELIVAGIIFDLLYGGANAPHALFSYFFSIGAIIVLPLVLWLQKQLWHYN